MLRYHLWAVYLSLLTYFITGCSLHERTHDSEAQVEKESQKTQNSESVRKLLIGLDGIGFFTFQKLQQGGHFRSFRNVAPLVATFPSISDPNWAHILQAPVEESYTKEHIDWSYRDSEGRGRIVGSLIDQVRKPPRYETLFDFKPEGMVEHLASMAWSGTTALYWLDALERDFFKHDPKKDFSAFILNTDIIAHTKGETAILKYLAEVDRRLQRIRNRHKEEFHRDLEIILVSDHGNAFLKPKAIFPHEILESKGWKVGSSVKDSKDVAFVFPEILSFGAFYTLKESEKTLAAELAAVEGIHVAFFRTTETTVDFLSGTTHHTRLTYSPKTKTLKYQLLKGSDPFDHIGFFNRSNSSLGEKDYFDLSLNTDYPNALMRAWEAFTKNSEVPAPVLVSPRLGYVFANKTLQLITKFFGLESVHGSFHKSESLGIMVSTHKEYDATVPSDFLRVTGFKRSP